MLKEMDEAGVDAALIHPPRLGPDLAGDGAGGGEEVPRPLRDLGSFDPKNPASQGADSDLAQPARHDGPALGLHPPEQKLLHEGALDWIWPEAEKAGLPSA